MILTAGTIRFHRLRSGGYELTEPWWCATGIVNQAARLDGQIALSSMGTLKVESGWPWDGPSGPTVDTPSFMRGSLAHDALYALMRQGRLGQENRRAADKLLYALCRQDGMGWFRAQYVYWGLRIGAGYAARPQREPEAVTLQAP